MQQSTGCGFCGKELIYTQHTASMTCLYCQSPFESDVSCPEGHFICDACHSVEAVDFISKYCALSEDTDPLRMAVTIMKHSSVKMHGPEHHFLVPAVLITAYYNQRGETGLKNRKLEIARRRADSVPGGFCGTHGNCGAAVGTGIFLSVILEATPLSGQEWMLCNRITGEILLDIAEQGGPRCCKRDSFLAIQNAVSFMKKNMDLVLPVQQVVCEFSDQNKQCRLENCTYFSPVGK